MQPISICSVGFLHKPKRISVWATLIQPLWISPYFTLKLPLNCRSVFYSLVSAVYGLWWSLQMASIRHLAEVNTSRMSRLTKSLRCSLVPVFKLMSSMYIMCVSSHWGPKLYLVPKLYLLADSIAKTYKTRNDSMDLLGRSLPVYSSEVLCALVRWNSALSWLSSKI